MTEYFQKNLFKDISIDEYKKLLSCLDGRTKQFRTGETICEDVYKRQVETRL